jgi:hypothetical protein
MQKNRSVFCFHDTFLRKKDGARRDIWSHTELSRQHDHNIPLFFCHLSPFLFVSLKTCLHQLDSLVLKERTFNHHWRTHETSAFVTRNIGSGPCAITIEYGVQAVGAPSLSRSSMSMSIRFFSYPRLYAFCILKNKHF